MEEADEEKEKGDAIMNRQGTLHPAAMDALLLFSLHMALLRVNRVAGGSVPSSYLSLPSTETEYLTTYLG